jgi:opacity protein-like surface antigen
MNMLTKLFAAALVSLASLSSAAAEGFFLTADAGVLMYTNTSTLTVLGVDFMNPGAINFGGGYNFNRYFAIEVAHTFVGDSTITASGFFSFKETLRSSANHVAAVGTLPIGDHNGIFGKIGLARTSIDYTNSGVGVSESASGSKTNAMWGIGWKYDFSEHWGMHVQFEDFGKTSVGPVISNGTVLAGTGGDIGMSLFSVGGEYKF